jgi:hypothetical protein
LRTTHHREALEEKEKEKEKEEQEEEEEDFSDVTSILSRVGGTRPRHKYTVQRKEGERVSAKHIQKQECRTQ